MSLIFDIAEALQKENLFMDSIIWIASLQINVYETISLW